MKLFIRKSTLFILAVYQLVKINKIWAENINFCYFLLPLHLLNKLINKFLLIFCVRSLFSSIMCLQN